MPLTHDLHPSDLHKLALRPGLRLEPLESAGGEIPDEETDAVIRQTLDMQISQVQPRGRDALPDIESQSRLDALRKRKRASKQKKPAIVPETVPEIVPDEGNDFADQADRTPADMSAELPQSDGVKMKERRAWIKPAVISALCVIFLFRPIWVIAPVFILFWGGLILFALVGAERLSRLYCWYAERRPERAEKLRRRADALAMKFDAILDRLPGRWAEVLSLPDFSRSALDPDSDDERPDPFSKIAAEARSI